MLWAKEEEQPLQVKQIIASVRNYYPAIRWTRAWMRNLKVDNDGIWFFWLADESGEVQIESSFGVCPLLVETDKINERFIGETVEQPTDKIIEWLAMSGGHTDYFWHPR